jgi:chemotaxis signal transduction protein
VTTPGFVLFRLGERTFATPLGDVREIVRLSGLESLPGARPPLAGVVVLRGTPLPVLDVRERSGDPSAEAGDVLVMDLAGDTAGIAVDAVLAVLPPDELPEADPPARALPAYVVGVRRHQDAPVLLVDLQRLLDVSAAGWQESLDVAATV